MHPGVLEMLRNYLGRPDREGRNRSMYRDTGGATVGIGCQLENVEEALPLPWELRSGGAWPRARDQVVADEWRRVAAGGDGRAGAEAIRKGAPSGARFLGDAGGRVNHVGVSRGPPARR